LLSTTAMLLALTVTSASAQGIYMGRDGRVHSSGIVLPPKQAPVRMPTEPVTAGKGCGGFGVKIIEAVEQTAKQRSLSLETIASNAEQKIWPEYISGFDAVTFEGAHQKDQFLCAGAKTTMAKSAT
jgi:hypothetical protein